MRRQIGGGHDLQAAKNCEGRQFTLPSPISTILFRPFHLFLYNSPTVFHGFCGNLRISYSISRFVVTRRVFLCKSLQLYLNLSFSPFLPHYFSPFIRVGRGLSSVYSHERHFPQPYISRLSQSLALFLFHFAPSLTNTVFPPVSFYFCL